MLQKRICCHGKDALDRSYDMIQNIHFTDMNYRRDIGNEFI